MDVLPPDSSLVFPQVTVLRASAGSGKTRTLTQHYVQLCLSALVPRAAPPNVLAITFSNNATREMKQQVLEWLKRLALADDGRLREMARLVTGDPAALPARALALLERLFGHWSDFRVQTIDSFMASVYRLSAIDFGFDPGFETVLDPAPLVSFAFELMLRDAREGSAEARLLDETAELVAQARGEEAGFVWDPAAALRAEIDGLERKLASLDAEVSILDLGEERRALQDAIRGALARVEQMVRRSGLEASARSKLPELLRLARADRWRECALTSMDTPPVKKPRRADPAYDEVMGEWERARAMVGRYVRLEARGWWAPWLRVHAGLAERLEQAKRARGAIFIGDVCRTLRTWLDASTVPEVFFRLGERVAHFLLDEFQDTSPVQWRSLFPLVENALAEGGSLFAVGDTRQAIYGFRDADWRIMRRLCREEVFASVPCPRTPELSVNWRSRPRVLELCRAVFAAATATPGDYRAAAEASGLAELSQRPVDPEGDPGYAEVVVLERDEGAEAAVLERVRELHDRGYRWGDIAILAMRNEEVTRASAWLAEASVPFLSMSSLDIRNRAVTRELLGLLAFLDSPPDDLAFASFLLGNLFASVLRQRDGWDSTRRLRELAFEARRGGSRQPLYKAFQLAFPELWDRYFAGLYRCTGYLPLYELASEALASLHAFETMPQEEATFARLLEAVRVFEGTGANSLHDFLAFSREEGAGEWDIPVPAGADSVRAMTVHKAKGLGFPAVLLLLRGERHRGTGSIVHEGPDGTELLHVTAEMAKRDGELSAIYDADRTAKLVDRMNALYVGLTRAKRELYVIGCRGSQDRYPFDLLPVDGFSPRADKGKASAETPTAEHPAALAHDSGPVAVVEEPGLLSHAERSRGVLVHRVLALVGAVDDLEAALAAAVERAAAEARIPAPAGLAATLAGALRRLGLADGFAPRDGREVSTEREFCDGSGHRFQMDRIEIDARRVLLIDWKTGSEEIGQPAQEAQVRGYTRILSQLWPGRTVEAVLAHLDRCQSRVFP